MEAGELVRNYVDGIERGERKVSPVNIVKLAHGLNVRPVKPSDDGYSGSLTGPRLAVRRKQSSRRACDRLHRAST